MTKVIAIALLAGALAACSLARAGAEEAATSPPSQSAAKPSQSSPGAGLPARFVSFLAGVVVGTPIAIARKTARAVVADTKELVGERTTPWLVVPVGMFTTPWALLTGTVEGAYAGPVDGWVYSADKAFSKDSLSLGEMK